VPLKGLEVGEQRSLQRLAPLPRPRCVRLQLEGLQPLALDQRFVERDSVFPSYSTTRPPSSSQKATWQRVSPSSP
jgi:hypothetical protein